jgi:hypothetical protein
MSIILSIGIPLLAFYIFYKWGLKKWNEIGRDEKREEIRKRKEEIEIENELYKNVKDVDLKKVQKEKAKVSEFMEETK